MKRIIDCCLIIAACILLISCGKEVESTKPVDDTKQTQTGTVTPQVEIIHVSSSGNYGIYEMSKEFSDKVESNPIDRDYKTEANDTNNFSTSKERDLELKYIKIWDSELNAIYNKLLAKLNSKEKDVLIDSQKGWLQYHTKESDFAYQVFYSRDTGPILGSQGSVQMQQAIKGRLRERTLELMEYYYLLGNNIEFVYK